MSAVLQLRRAIASTLQAETALTPTPGRLAGVRVYEHGGEFDNIHELKRYARVAPAVFIAVLHLEGAPKGGLPEATVSLGAFVLTQDIKARDESGDPLRSEGKRDAQAIAIVESLMDYILRFPTKDFGAGAGKPANVHARNLFDEKFDSLGAACWGVFWEQTVDLVTAPAPVLSDFLELHIDYEVEDE